MGRLPSRNVRRIDGQAPLHQPMASLPSLSPPPDWPRKTARRHRLGLLRWPAMVLLVAGAYAAVSRLPYVFAPAQTPVPGTPPSAAILLAVGLAVTLVSGGIAYLAIGARRSFPFLVVSLAVAYNALIVVVDFVLGLPGVWHQTYLADFPRSSTPTPAQIQAQAVSNAAGTAIWDGISLFLLYAGVLTILFVSYRLRTRVLLERLGQGRPVQRVMAVPLAAVFIVAGSLLFAGLFVFPFTTRSPYIGELFSGGAGLLAAVMMAAAISAAAGAFELASRRAVLIRDASALTALFWLALALLAVYHVLWVVYILTLLAMWPVKFTVLYHGK